MPIALLESLAVCALFGAYVVMVLRFDPTATQPLPYRATRAVRYKEGDLYLYAPWSYFDYIRQLLGAYTYSGVEGGLCVYEATDIAYGFLSCHKCLSLWASAPAVIFMWLGGYVSIALLLPLWFASAFLAMLALDAADR